MPPLTFVGHAFRVSPDDLTFAAAPSVMLHALWVLVDIAAWPRMPTVATKWTIEWVQPEDLHELILSPRSIQLHFPNIFKHAYRSAAVVLDAMDGSDRPSTDCSYSDASSSSV
eukprot:CAMPEP_0179069226 /NCGR_PEP_ID=MMETSP0796-20121207/30400_1 /TAXON_ID=73915 /ORGANISM="Pyrodinium bahamense, Strain pbaha01" /LENGTH=112 /DNA_ID=CAMNT_0020766289 /DNA_START=58 /DNA_END=395 /DNA_ORIENTATION=+